MLLESLGLCSWLCMRQKECSGVWMTEKENLRFPGSKLARGCHSTQIQEEKAPEDTGACGQSLVHMALAGAVAGGNCWKNPRVMCPGEARPSTGPPYRLAGMSRKRLAPWKKASLFRGLLPAMGLCWWDHRPLSQTTQLPQLMKEPAQ